MNRKLYNPEQTISMLSEAELAVQGINKFRSIQCNGIR